MIKNYSQMKAFLLAYAGGDPRIKEILWGEDKRAQDASGGRAISPYFWVRDYSMVAREQMNGETAIYYWDLVISIKMSNPRQHIIPQELAMGETFMIAQDFLQYLNYQARAGVIDFSLSNSSMQPDENYEKDSFYGWDLSIRIGELQSCYKFTPGQGRYQTCAFLPDWAGESGLLAIEINETVFSQAWDAAANIPIILHRLVKDINASGGNYTSWTDGSYLYVRSTSVQLAIDTDTSPSQNAHAWTTSQCLEGQGGSVTPPTGDGIGTMIIGSTFIVR